MAAYKVAAEGGDAQCQNQVGCMYHNMHDGDADSGKQSLIWLKKAAAQDYPASVGALGLMYSTGQGVTPSWRRARQYYERAIELGDFHAMQNLQNLTQSIQNVTSQRSIHSAPASLVRVLILPFLSLNFPTSFPDTLRPRLSWTSGWRFTARAGRT